MTFLCRAMTSIPAGLFMLSGAAALAQGAPACDWVPTGGDPGLDADMCHSDPAICATDLNTCLQPFDFDSSPNWWLFTANDGLQQGAETPIHINHQTPQHGLFLAVYVNKIAHDALVDLLARPVAPDSVSLPAGSVVAKVNYASRAEFEGRANLRDDGDQWLTVMAKIDGFCQPNVGGTCNGGNWFYYLSRFGKFLTFQDVLGTNPDGSPIEGPREAALGQPSAFCTDCHNPVERTDFLWTLDAAFWKTDVPQVPLSSPMLTNTTLTPSDTCQQGAFQIDAVLPDDVPGNPGGLSPDNAQAMFDCFSWRSFIALNWAADPNFRGQPDTGTPFPSLGRDRVWESYKETFEVFQPGIADWTVDPDDWNTQPELPPACVAELDGLDDATRARFGDAPKQLTMVSKTRANQVLNETHQAFGNQFNVLIDQTGRVVRYEVRFNQDEFQYLAENGFADTGNYSYSGPVDGTQVFFPTNSTGITGAGSIEIKAAWRELCGGDVCTGVEDQEAERYYWVPALRYIPAAGDRPAQCQILPKVGLIGLHIIRKTDTAPQWVWSTFEHVDNVPPANAAPAADVTYTLFNPQCLKPENMPTEAQCATQRPGVLPAGNPELKFPANKAECCANLQLLANARPAPLGQALSSRGMSGLLHNQVTRLDPIGPVEMNRVVTNAIREADPANPFQYYRLINTQWPKNARDSDTGAANRLSCAQTGFVGRDDAPCYTIVPRKGNDSLRLRNTSMETFQVSTNGPGAADPAHFSSAGCINCHGDAGVDFSFVFTDGIEIDTPAGGQ
ncbi:MAG: hypothetical protein QNJ44_20590 [Rhodobacter sp.]|nr:hypothetical protein [Rhodobacter sp.]